MWLHKKFPLAAAIAALLLAGTGARAELSPGDAFPSLAAAGLTGGTLPATEGKVVLVDFWASWCAPCKASFPSYSRLNADFADRGLVIVAVSVDQRESDYLGFVRKWHPPFVTLLDKDQKLVSTVHVPAMPTSYLIGRDGRVRFVHEGFHGGETDAEIRKHIEAVLAEKS